MHPRARHFRHPVLLLALLLCAGAGGGARAAEHHYRIDPEHSRILFRIGHMELSRTLGTFSGIDGEIRFDTDRWEHGSASAEIPLARLSLDDPKWERKVRDDYLQADRHPTAHFESTGIDTDASPVADGYLATLHGQLTLNGISHPVDLRLRYNGEMRSIYTKLRRKAGFSALGRIRRSDFGLDKHLDQVGDEVEIEIELEAFRDGGSSR